MRPTPVPSPGEKRRGGKLEPQKSDSTERRLPNLRVKKATGRRDGHLMRPPRWSELQASVNAEWGKPTRKGKKMNEATRKIEVLKRLAGAKDRALEDLQRAFPHGRPAGYAKGYDDRYSEYKRLEADANKLEQEIYSLLSE